MLLSILLTIFNYVICFQNNKIRLKELHRFEKKTNYRFIPFIPPINKSTQFINQPFPPTDENNSTYQFINPIRPFPTPDDNNSTYQFINTIKSILQSNSL
jgi:hypothetical protein